MAPRRSPGLILGTLGRSWGDLGGPKVVKSRKTQFVPPRPGSTLGALFGIFFFFHEKVRSRSVFFAGFVFYGVSVRFLVDFRRPGTPKTLIIAESGIKIKKITKSRPELHRERFWEAFWLTFAPLWTPFGRLWPKKRLLKTTLKKSG